MYDSMLIGAINLSLKKIRYFSYMKTEAQSAIERSYCRKKLADGESKKKKIR
jgi:hypothetical protein